MPISADYQAPVEKIFLPLKPDYYAVKVMDIVFEIKPNKFKDKDGNVQPDVQQFKITLETLDKEPGRRLMVWVNDALTVSKKAKRPEAILPVFLQAILGRSFGPADRDQMTPDFINALIGSELRVSTGVKGEYTSVLGFFSK